MGFEAFLRFGGLCAHVFNAPVDSNPTRLWVVMPDARTPIKDSICPHFPAFYLEAAHLQNSPTKTGGFFHGIARDEVTFRLTGAGGIAAAPLTVPATGGDTDFRFIPDLGRIAPERADIHPRFKKDHESLGRVAARIIVEHGTLQTLGRTGNPPLHFHPGAADIATAAAAQPFALDVVVALGELDKLEINTRDMDDGTKESFVLQGITGKCEIFFGNLCGDLWVKELGNLPPYPEPVGEVIDTDFEAFYVLSNPMPTSNPLGPLPRFQQEQGGSGGAKCNHARFNAFVEA